MDIQTEMFQNMFNLLVDKMEMLTNKVKEHENLLANQRNKYSAGSSDSEVFEKTHHLGELSKDSFSLRRHGKTHLLPLIGNSKTGNVPTDGSSRQLARSPELLHIDVNASTSDMPLEISDVTASVDLTQGPEKHVLKKFNIEPSSMRNRDIALIFERLENIEESIQELADKSNTCQEDFLRIIALKIPEKKNYDNFSLRSDTMSEDELPDIPQAEKDKPVLKPPITIEDVWMDKLKDMKPYKEWLKSHSIDDVMIRKQPKLYTALQLLYTDFKKKIYIIHQLIAINREVLRGNKFQLDHCLKRKVNDTSFNNFKNLTNAKYQLMKDEIEEYILRDPEAAGIINFVKGETCMSCSKPVMMKTTKTDNKLYNKDCLKPRSHMKAHLTYDLDRVRELHHNKKQVDIETACKKSLAKPVDIETGCKKSVAIKRNRPEPKKKLLPFEHCCLKRF